MIIEPEPYYTVGIVFLFVPLIILVTFIINIAISIWIYKDAKKRNMEAAIWLLIVLFSSIIGVIIYLIVRNPVTPRNVEQSPTSYYSKNKPFTPNYAPIPEETSVKFCENCGHRIYLDAVFCPQCGREV